VKKIILIVAAVIFAVVFIAVAYFITVRIFNGIVGNITNDIIGSLIGGSQEIEKKPCTTPRHQREFNSNAYYEGPLIDSHVHFPTSSTIVSSVAQQNGLEMPVLEGEISGNNLVCLFESEGITKTFGFHITSKFAEDSAISTAKAIEKAYPGKIVHFLMPPPIRSLNINPSGIKRILEDNKGVFKGFGEVALYMDGYGGVKPDDPEFKEIYKLADEHSLIVMIHPEDNQRDGVEEILREFPNVTFFFHGGRNQEWIIDLMPKYKNFYYSLDADLISLYLDKETNRSQKLTKEEFLTYIRGNFNSVLDNAVSRWKERITVNQDRFTWGTDRWFAWHFDPQVSGILEEFGRSFIGRLDVSVQENFAYRNAERMLKTP